MACSRRQAGVVRLVKIHGVERDCALALTKKARRAALTYKNGYTCRVCDDAFERHGLLEEHVAQHSPDVMPIVEERPKRVREEEATDDGNALQRRWCAKKCTAQAWLRQHIIQKHQKKKLLRGAAKVQDAPVSDGEAVQEKQEEKEFECQQCHRVLKNKTWFIRHKCTATSIINSGGSNVVEQSVTATRPICSEECRYRRLLRHLLAKHPGHDESLPPQPRAKPKRKEMRSEAQGDVEGSGPLESAEGRGRGENAETSPGGSPHGR
ncbi:hypothetical protein TRVL_07727 [Trypanosoma vivax]|nr:hypothetical protein TRVL_07727 [Trypanosoma vivax]